MLQKSFLFFHTAEENKNYNEEMEFSLAKTSPFFIISTILTICILISILGLIGNGIIFWLLCCTIKKTKFTVYVANLAAGDFLALLRAFFTNLQWFIPDLINNRSGQILLIMFLFGHENNSYFLAAMSTERCLTVFSPVWYQSHRQKCSTAIVCTFLWALSVMLTMLDYFFCTQKYISVLNIGTAPCKVEKVLTDIVFFIIIIIFMTFSTLALCIRVKTKPEQDFPTRLDISIWITVVLHLMIYTATKITNLILFYIPSLSYEFGNYCLDVISYCVGSSVNPFVYLLVGCWKWEKGQEPCYMFLERALKDNGKGSMRIQPYGEQV